jgi:1-acyl-sn-glycerol-3-phosphate acyltransferase
MSILDIPTIPLIDKNIAYVGKSELRKIPLFGYVFKIFHIPVDRQNYRSRYNTIIRSKEELDNGKNLAIFPEGGIITTSPPEMVRFKDGPFRIAIEKQVPIVPVTIPFNWIILPDNKKLRLNKRNHKLRIIVHQPIPTNGMTLDDLADLKKTTFNLIDLELKKQNRK